MQTIINLKYNFMRTYKNFSNLSNPVSVGIATGRCRIDHSRERGVISIHKGFGNPFGFVAFSRHHREAFIRNIPFSA